MKLTYIIAPDATAKKSLHIDLHIDNVASGKSVLKLFRQSVVMSEFACRDRKNKPIPFQVNPDFIGINIANGEKRLTISYSATLGSIGRHGHAGGVYDDMVVFDGENVLLVPEEALSASDSMLRAAIRSIDIEYRMPEEWRAFIPYQSRTHADAAPHTRILSPTLFDMYQLKKSCCAFARFSSVAGREATPGFTIAIDPAIRASYYNEYLSGINSIYDYFARIFGSKPSDFALVIIRPDSSTGQHIMGGVGLSATASSFNPENPRDWQLLSHRFFHAFFDAQMPTSFFHRAPQIWLYEGLATYYENAALESLPGDIQAKLRIDVRENFLALYRRYMYMRVTDASFALAPMKEPAIKSSASIEFLHYTQAPLLVKWLEDQSTRGMSSQDRILRYVLRNRHTLKDLKPVLSYAVIHNPEEFNTRYVFGADIMPMWYLAAGPEDSAKVALAINEYARMIYAIKQKSGTSGLDDAMRATALPGSGAGNSGVNPALTDSIQKISPTLGRLLVEQISRIETLPEEAANE